MTDMQKEQVQSPCIGVCSIDETSGFCLGCYRTIDEIKTWWEIGACEQKALLQTLEKRQMQSISFD